jgi:uncharacterized protein
VVNPAPGLYTGTLRHRRFEPVAHAFRYTIFMVLVDIDRLAEAMAVSPFTSLNRPNWASFDDRDHLGDPGRPLRERVCESAARAGHRLPDGPVLLLTHLRYGGYAFNPISLYYCYDCDGRLPLVMAEVHNTFGGRQIYWLPRGDRPGPLRATQVKSLYVSPFMPWEVAYDFVLTAPADALVAHMNVRRQDVPETQSRSRIFDATLQLRRRPWTTRELHRALLRVPLMTTKVMAAIHWQALRLYLKGVPVVPAAPGTRGAPAPTSDSPPARETDHAQA